MNAQQFGRSSTGYSRVSGDRFAVSQPYKGRTPVDDPGSQSMRFTDRQTSTIARTNFSQTRFATHMTPSSVQRGSFGRTGTSGSGSSTIPGTRAFGNTPGTFNVPRNGSQSSSQSGGWNRFGSTSRLPWIDVRLDRWALTIANLTAPG